MMSKEKRRVPKLRFPGFTEDWEQRKLGDLAEIVRGASPRPISDPKWFDNDSSVGWLRIADVTAQDGRIRYLEQKISELGQEKTRVIKTPHLLLSIAATVGKPVINYVPTGVHDGFLIFLNPKFNILYTFWWLEMFREKWNKYGQPGSQVNLNSDLVKNQVINIPNEKEQEKISSFLESLDKIITLHQRKLDNLKLKKKALLQKLFPKNGERYPELRFPEFTDAWEQRKLGDLMEVTSVKRIHQADWTDSGVRFFRARDIVSSMNNEEVDNPVFISEDKYEEYSRISGKVIAGDLLVTGVGTIGIPYLIKDTTPLYFKDGNIIWFKNNNILNGKYFYYCFQNNHIQSQIYSASGKGTVGTYTIENGKKTSISYPSLKEQVKIGKLLDTMTIMITLHQRKLDHLQLQKKALLQQMFV